MRRRRFGTGVVLLALGAPSTTETLRLRDGWQGARLMPAVGIRK